MLVPSSPLACCFPSMLRVWLTHLPHFEWPKFGLVCRSALSVHKVHLPEAQSAEPVAGAAVQAVALGKH